MKKYQIIYADPCWKYNTKGNVPPDREVENHYSTMTIKELCLLPIKDISDKDCFLFMWVIMPKLNEFAEVVSSWGFEYKTTAFVWVKRNKKSDSDFFGLGRYTRANVEICIVAKKGHPKIVDHSISQLIYSPIREHSRKPDVVKEKIVQLCGILPRIELFARERTPGWDAWGNEVECDITLLPGDLGL